jgi:hypothetical protein
MKSQGIGDKLNTQEGNNSIYILKIQNMKKNPIQKIEIKWRKNSSSIKSSVCVLGIGNQLNIS